MNFSELMSLAAGHVEARLVQTALELEVFDALESSALTAQEVAERRKFDPSAAELLLNALTALQLLHKSSGTFSLAGVAQKYLVKNSPHYVGGMIRFESLLWNCWEKLPQAIRTGQPVRMPNMYQDERNETEIFINAMDSLVKARGDADAVASALDWNSVAILLDIGSGPATYPIALCKRFTNLSATVFDLPGTLKITERYVSQAGMSERIKLFPGDYRNDPIPGNYDVIFLSNIIHGENDERNAELITKLARNLNPSGRIVIKDHILDESRANPPVGAIFSLLMLLTTEGGRCYSFGEVKRWMNRAGLIQVSQLDFPPPLTSSLVIGTR